MKLPFPKKSTSARRSMISTFSGINRTDTCNDDTGGKMYFSDMVNGGSDNFPFAASRTPRSLAATYNSPGGISGRDRLAVIADGKLIYGAETIDMGLSDGEKQIIGFGAYILIFPDQKWYNTASGEQGDMNEGAASVPKFTRRIKDMSLVYKDGAQTLQVDITLTGDIDQHITSVGMSHVFLQTSYNSLFANRSEVPPQSFDSDDYYIDNFAEIIPYEYEGKLLYLYSADVAVTKKTSDTYSYSLTNVTWREMPIESIRIWDVAENGAFPLDGALDRIWSEGKHISVEKKVLPASRTVYEISGAQVGAKLKTSSNYLALEFSDLHEQKIPVFDYVTACDNRLFGCYKGYQYDSFDVVNCLYASALGDFKEWYKFEGISTDSWFAACGEDGEFTAACTFGGHPMFFREDCAYILYGDYPPYSYSVVKLRGVARGAHRSLVEINGTLFYKSRDDIMCYGASSTRSISERLGNISAVSNAVAGAYRDKYYIALDGKIFVWDILRGIWCAEDEQAVISFAECGGKLYFICTDGKLYCIGGEATDNFEWSFTTGEIGSRLPNHKYVSKLQLRIDTAESDAVPTVEISEDGGAFIPVATNVSKSGGVRTGTVYVPIRPRRCEQFRIRISGEGRARLTGITKYIEESGK